MPYRGLDLPSRATLNIDDAEDSDPMPCSSDEYAGCRKSSLFAFAIMFAALAPIWGRLYIQCCWARVPGTVVRVDLKYNYSPMPGWIWVPTIEFDAAGQHWSFAKNYWQHPGGKPAYKVGDEVELLCHPRKPWRFMYKDSWLSWMIAVAITWQMGLYLLTRLPPDV